MPTNDETPKDRRKIDPSETRPQLKALAILVSVAILVVGTALFYKNISQPRDESSIEKISTPNVVPDFRIEDYILEKPRDFEKILGRETQRGDCPDLESGSRIDYERGYICVQDGLVALIAYIPLRVPQSPKEALSFVGLATGTPPQHPGGTAYQWSQWGKNPIRVKDRLATRVMVNTSEQAPVIIVSLGRE